MAGQLVYVEKNILVGNNPRPEIGLSVQVMEALERTSILYKHYGIDVGEEKVVHYSGDMGMIEGDMLVRLSTREEFSQGQPIYQENELNLKFSTEEIIERAMGRVGSNFGGFNLLDNNSETFALWCVTGALYTRQNFGLDVEQLMMDIEEDRDESNIVPIFLKQQNHNLQGVSGNIPTDLGECSMFNYLSKYYQSRQSDFKHQG
jgi:hypothetical protein